MVMKGESKSLRIGVVMDDPLRIEGLRAVLAEVAELVPMTALETLHDSSLAMVLIDGRADDLPVRMAAFRRARPGMRIIVLGDDNDAAHIGRVIATGAKGYLLFTATAREIRMAVEIVADGSIWAPRRVLANLIDTQTPGENRPADVRLTTREREVMELLIAGKRNREIAEALQIEVKTVKTHVSRVLLKFGVADRKELIVRAGEHSAGSRRSNA